MVGLDEGPAAAGEGDEGPAASFDSSRERFSPGEHLYGCLALPWR